MTTTVMTAPAADVLVSPATSARSPADGSPVHVPATTVVLVSAHGGSGASTLADHLPDTVSEVDLTPVTVNGAAHCVVVASATVDGVVAATHAVRRLASVNSAPAIHLALVRDGRGLEPLGARARVRALSVFVASVTELPHVSRWRYEQRELRTRSPGYLRAVGRLVEAVTPSPAPTGRAQRRRANGATS